ncbi:MAG: acetyl-CoA carboxylase biotin carboxyl carrier protein [Sphingomicrobium sp.]
MAESKKPVPSKVSANASDGEDAMRIDPALVRELAELLTENALTEIEVADGARQIRVQRLPGYNFVGNDMPAAPAAAAAPAPAPAAPAPVEEVVGETVKSPMVGTAFLSPEPSAAPFVAVGDAVKPGDTLLIVEAMKVMNPITAPSGGIVKKILVADAQPVEFDQPLVILG